MQSQMIGMQSTLDRILSAVQSQTQLQQNMAQQAGVSPYPTGPLGRSQERFSEAGDAPPRSRFPPLPGFAPPVRTPPTYPPNL
jgi:septal ring-binding cell division protein DamX